MSFIEIPDEVPVVKPNLKIADSTYHGQVVETRKQDFFSLATFGSGMKMACDYYSQVAGKDNAAASYQDDLPPVFGQYHLVRGFELIITTPLSHQQNNDGAGEWVSTGSGTVYSCITPQNGEMFIADIGNGQEAFFQVNNPRRQGIYPESPTEIDFKITFPATKELIERLNKYRVVETFYFHRENYRNGVKCLLRREEVDINRRLVDAFRRMVPLYFRDFFADRFNTFLVPGQLTSTYDPNVVKFLKSILGTEHHHLMNTLTELGVAHDVYSNQITLFDVIAKRDYNLLYSASRHLQVAHVERMRQHALMRSIVFSGVKQMLIAVDVANSNNNPICPPGAWGQLQDGGVRQPNMRSILPNLDLTDPAPAGPPVTELVKPILVDDFYVLSQQFYDDVPGQSKLEVLVGQTLRGQAIDLEVLADVADASIKFDNLERFYYTPIILALIKMASGVL